ncbi:hypothetical protein ANSO36C_11680 [Nostoc cf. commune SO-36]|uniref:Uncharacterized protein n=1 Tax=Nostoc cf. commune SO-36 TaxID=449208 RepID=A0ABM7YXJ1_NOSCO|nr:hypothetical protein ANSO36C_11680 [Nostoc cf. commune SO-36]
MNELVREYSTQGLSILYTSTDENCRGNPYQITAKASTTQRLANWVVHSDFMLKLFDLLLIF